MTLSEWFKGGGQPGVGRVPIDEGYAKRVPSEMDWRPPIYAETGIHMSGIGYVGADAPGVGGRPPMNLEPNVDYLRPPATPTYDRAWQGFQKENALALLQYSSRHPGMGPHVPGTDPPDSIYGDTRPLTYGNEGRSIFNTNKVPAEAGAVGPGLSWMPNPTNPTASYAGASSPGLWATIRSRLFG